ncbi:MAG: magnesium chelatase domain-containing protein [candidate division WOR-3 bacterium]
MIGVEGFLVDIDVYISNESSSNELFSLTERRILSVIRNIGFDIPYKKIRINLSPPNVRKESSLFDLPIAIGILSALGYLDYAEFYKRFVIVGELSFDGKLKEINEMLPLCLVARKLNYDGIIVPYGSRYKISIIDGIKVYMFENLVDVINFLKLKINKYNYSKTGFAGGVFIY